ncbi:MAG: hypothetical protein WCC74_01755 [Minisyncoccia bacterium]
MKRKGRRYVSYGKSIILVKCNQQKKWDPHYPHTKVARALFTSVASWLGVGKKTRELRIFVAIGTPLDLFHGVDLFFEYRHQIVTIDLKLKPRKGIKAHFLITLEDIRENRYYQISREIASELNKKVEEEKILRRKREDFEVQRIRQELDAQEKMAG